MTEQAHKYMADRLTANVVAAATETPDGAREVVLQVIANLREFIAGMDGDDHKPVPLDTAGLSPPALEGEDA